MKQLHPRETKTTEKRQNKTKKKIYDFISLPLVKSVRILTAWWYRVVKNKSFFGTPTGRVFFVGRGFNSSCGRVRVGLEVVVIWRF